MECNKLGGIACFLSQKATASHSRGLQHRSLKGINTPPFPHPVTLLGGGPGWGVGPQSPGSLTRGCGPIWSPQKLGSSLVNLKNLLVFLKPETHNPRGTKQLSLTLCRPPGDALAPRTPAFSLHSPVALGHVGSTCSLQEGAWTLQHSNALQLETPLS